MRMVAVAVAAVLAALPAEAAIADPAPGSLSQLPSPNNCIEENGGNDGFGTTINRVRC
jgi:hypothetical protein